MFKWFRKHFIPHDGNDHQPHFLRSKNVRVLVFAIFVIELGVLVLPYIPVLSPANNNYMASVLPAVLDDLANQNRQKNNLNTLTVNPELNKVAELKAKDMAEKGYFAHISPEGKAPWYWFNMVGYKYEYAGENLAVDFTDSQDVTLAWMNSPTHRANVMKNSYTEMGTAVASGNFEGRQTVFVVQVYGKPALPIAPISIEEKIVSKIIALATNATATPIVESEPVSNILGATSEIPPVQTYKKTNIFEQYLASPRHVANAIFFLFGMLMISALVFKLFIHMDKRHPILITNGLIVLVLIFGVYTINNYMAKKAMANNTTFVSFTSEVLDQNI